MANVSWYTIFFDPNYYQTITSITMNNQEPNGGQSIAAAKVWFDC